MFTSHCMCREFSVIALAGGKSLTRARGLTGDWGLKETMFLLVGL